MSITSRGCGFESRKNVRKESSIVPANDLGGGILVRCTCCYQTHPFRDEWLGKEIERLLEPAIGAAGDQPV
jgi:hypothetical protein